MILFIRNEKGNTIFELEYWIKSADYPKDGTKFLEISTSIDVFEYTQLLIHHPIGKLEEISIDFNGLTELRGWLWEKYFMGRQNDIEEYDRVLVKLRKFVGDVAEKYDLRYVED